MKQCPHCNKEIDSKAVLCIHCGRMIAVAEEPGAVARALLPVGRSGFAIAAGYLALFSILLAPAPLAIICGVVAYRDIKKNPQKHGMGRAWFGIIMGALGTGVIAFMILKRQGIL